MDAEVTKGASMGIWDPSMVWDSKLNLALVYGGYTSNCTNSNTTRTFDPATNTWKTLDPVQEPGRRIRVLDGL